MNNKLALALLVLLAGGGFWWFKTHRAAPILNAPPRPGPIVAFGDSLTAGNGAGSPDNAYPAVMSRMIGRPILNAGRPGDTIAQAAGRLQADVLSRHPSIVIVLLGGNDLLRMDNMDQAFADLERIVRTIQADGAMVVLVGLQGLSPIGGVAGRYKALGKHSGVLFVPDILDGIFGNPALMSDGIHPNAEGYRMIAERLAKAIRPYVPGAPAASN